MEYVTVVEGARRLEISEKTIRRAIHAGKLPARYPQPNRCEIAVSDLEAWRQAKVTPTAQEETNHRLAEMERRLRQLEVQVQQLLDVQRVTSSPAKQKQPHVTKLRTEANSLPDGYLLLQSFADLHGISRNEAERRWRSGFITGKKGKWTQERQRETIALDARGRRDFWVQFHQTDGFRPCDACPHVDQDPVWTEQKESE